MTAIRKSTIQFLKNIGKHNNKPWFEENKEAYLDAKTNMENFLQEVMNRLNDSDVIEKFHLYRIYRDVRFSKDKTPYKSYLHAHLRRQGAERRGGYWIGIEPGNTHIGGGFYGPEKDDLMRIRKEFEYDGKTITSIITAPKFKQYFGHLKGEGVKTAPKGFDKEHKNIELIRKKQFYAMRPFTDDEVFSPDFIHEVVGTLEAVRPFFDYMTDVLTTDLNGRSTLK